MTGGSQPPQPQLWEVYRVFAPDAGKLKRVILIGIPTAGMCLALYINSRRTPFLAHDQNWHYSLDVPATGHVFLNYDSVVTCDKVHTVDPRVLKAGELLGRVPKATAMEIVTTAENCEVLPRRDQKLISAIPCRPEACPLTPAPRRTGARVVR